MHDPLHAARSARRPSSYALRTILTLGLVAMLGGLTAFGTFWRAPVQAAVSAPPGASVRVKVQVPASMRSSPFDVDRYLNVPPGFSIAVYARISSARFLAVAPNGDLLVSQPSTGKVLLVRPNGSGDPNVSDFVTGLRKPHDIVFHTIGGVTYVYISETNQVNRFIYNNGDTTAHDRQVVVSGLPDASTPELHGAYGHELKNIALDSNHKLYVSIASTCNACLEDTVSNPVRGAIYQYNADGTGGRLFARGLRNAEGLAFVPGTTNLWVAVNNRDNIAYPYHQDFDGDGADDYGKVMQAYVDNHPPEEFTRVRDGGNSGWPFCNPNPDTASGVDNMPFDRDVQFNADGSKLDCNTADKINKGIQAHSAPLGLTFLQDTSFASAYRNGAVIGLHGSWNRAQKTGYKVIYFPWDSATQTPGAQIDLVTGWLDTASNSNWGRPVDTAVDQQGNMFISDDGSGTIYKLAAAPSGSGDGLKATYYDNANFTGKSVTRTDATVNFDWGGGSPDPNIGADTFSARWTGQVQPRFSETYTFYTTSDDGIRLWVNGKKVIDNWTDHPPTENSGTIALQANQKYQITLEFYENGGGAVSKLSWSSASQAKEIIPQSQLFSSAGNALLVVGSATLNAGDSAARARLAYLGYNVTVQTATAATSADANGKAVVLISSTVLSGDVNTKFRNATVPVLTWEHNLLDDLGMTGNAASDHNTLSGQTQVSMVAANAGSSLAAGRSGTVTVASAAGDFSWGKPNSAALSIATVPGNAAQVVDFAYPSGAAMPGLTAPARRVALFMTDATAASMTGDGWALFDAAVTWAVTGS